MEKTIRVTCEGAALVPLEQLEEFQGTLKNLSQENYLKLRDSLIQHGFTAPCFVWRDGEHKRILDAHQRIRVLRRMIAEEGYTLQGGAAPVAWIDADNEQEARRKVFLFISQYGETSYEQVYEFASMAGVDLQDLVNFASIPDIDSGRLLKAFSPETPDEFRKFDETIETEHQCPRCRYRWSGSTKVFSEETE